MSTEDNTDLGVCWEAQSFQESFKPYSVGLGICCNTNISVQAELDYLAMKRENKNLNEENGMLQARLRQYVDQMASQVSLIVFVLLVISIW